MVTSLVAMNLKYDNKRHTIEGVLHLLCYSQYFLASMKALEVLVTGIADLPIQVCLNLFVEVVD